MTDLWGYSKDICWWGSSLVFCLSFSLCLGGIGGTLKKSYSLYVVSNTIVKFALRVYIMMLLGKQQEENGAKVWLLSAESVRSKAQTSVGWKVVL